MRLKQTGLWLLMIVLLGLTGCFGSKDPNANQAVCIYDGASIREEANKDGKWLSSLSLGETGTFEGKAVADPKDPKTEYIKVKLSDGTKGYVNVYCVVLGAYVGVIQEPAKIYKRPDLLSESSKKYDTMDIVAVEEESGDWVRVTGEGRAKSGWVEKGMIRKTKEDIVTAVMLRKAIKAQKGEMTQEEMEKTVATLAYPNSYFALKMLEKYTPATVDEYVDGEAETTPDETPSEGDVNAADSADSSETGD
ncbi:MAG TPA: hypothetical protein VHY08_28755 [Bacillota bacterium]|nr:hypothetical protein [Bacillota bacterium]